MSKLTKQIIMIIIDIISIQISFYFAFYLRFEKNLFVDPAMSHYLEMYISVILTVTILKIFSLYFLKIYSSLWKYASFDDLIQLLFATTLGTVLFISYSTVMQVSFPRSIYVLTFICDSMLFSSYRISRKFYSTIKDRRFPTSNDSQDYTNVLIIGAGLGGSTVIRELKTNKSLKCRPVAIIDDDINKVGKNINGVPVLGTKLSIRDVVLRYDIKQIIIAIPSATKSEIKEILAEASKTKCELKILSGINDFNNGNINTDDIRSVEITDLLGREEINLNNKDMENYIYNKNIMVTGGGGSIGSELCRQLSVFKPKKIIILDIYENNAFSIENEFKNNKYSDIEIEVVIASVRDKKRIFEIVEEYKPDVIFHAAAHKHVPLMEKNPVEAVKNNIFGSHNVMEAARQYKVDKFVLISTDKAVNPTNIMGATKRFTEILVQSYNRCETTTFVAVRFGNVLDSNGSVLPTFKKQIEEGGPVTVTHPDITRYFMTIPEASRLVIQASSFGRNGEIFVLDMGEPVKIVTLAENLIRLSGLTPYEDIKIDFIGLRAGEKMFEELILNEENSRKTIYEKIFIEKQDDIIDRDVILSAMDKLEDAIKNNKDVRCVLSEFIPSYVWLDDK